MSTHFRNPYNFAPFADPPADRYVADDPDKNPLGQGAPAGHDRYRPGLWTGTIDIEIEVVTPLLVPDLPENPDPKDGHKTFGMRTRDGKPLLPVTTLKGPLRAAYEIVTNSRMGVFGKHDAPPARRMQAREALDLVPARIVRRAPDEPITVELWVGRRGSDFGDRRLPLIAAWLPRYAKGKGGIAKFAVKLLDTGRPPQHRDSVHCWLELWERRGDRPFKYYRVLSAASDPNALGPRPAPSTENYGAHRPVMGKAAELIAATGYAFISEQNIGNKHDERVFFVPTGSRPVSIVLDSQQSITIERTWKLLIDDYRTQNKDVLEDRADRRVAPSKFEGRDIGKTALSRHLFAANAERLTDGTLCYASVSGNAERGLHLEALYPVMIGRELGQVSPRQMAPERLLPATRLEQLSPADRVFGWVRQDKGTDNANGPGAWKGQLRIRPITCTEGEISSFGTEQNGTPSALPLAILAEPKVAQARFYVGDSVSAPDGRLADVKSFAGDVRSAGYFGRPGGTGQTTKRLRGRKVYPHHASATATEGYWSPKAAHADANAASNAEIEAIGGANAPLYREYVRRRSADKGNADTQNRSITGWIAPRSKFSAPIDVVNLSRTELGALLWVLDLPADGERRSHHRIGGGKPLGFGSVIIRTTAVDVREGERIRSDLAARLGTVEGHRATSGTATNTSNDFIDAFRAATEAAYGKPLGQVPFIAAFLAAARGYSDYLPTHYPRGTNVPDRAGKSYEWFVANGRKQPAAQQQSLPAADSDRGLPYRP